MLSVITFHITNTALDEDRPAHDCQGNSEERNLIAQ
jgi:hypothetical protein